VFRTLRERLGLSWRIPVEVQAPRRGQVEGRVLYSYTRGPVSYTLYLDALGRVRLRVEEPPRPPPERIRDLVSGLASPASEEEAYWLERHRSGYGPLYPLISDGHVEEIAYSGPGTPVLVVHRRFPGVWVAVDMELSEEEADALAVQLARKAGKLVSIAQPVAEGLTQEGYRVATTFRQEVSRKGSSFVLRKYAERPLSAGDILASETITPVHLAFLWLVVEAQMFTLVVGPMGSGKTTLLQALIDLTPPHTRVVTVEDTPELRPVKPYWDPLHTRPSPAGESVPDIDLEAILRFALRRRAEYIVVGEVRGREAKLLAQAAALGHGSMATFHADSPQTAIARLQLEPIALPPLFLKLLSCIVVVKRLPAGEGGVKRRVTEIAAVIEGEEVETVAEYNPKTDRLQPEDPVELAETPLAKQAWRRLGEPGDLAVELMERAEVLKTLTGAPPEEVYRALSLFYTRRVFKTTP
jgi:flagellar protein FlaI